jgi:2-isopropylmalate synthase
LKEHGKFVVYDAEHAFDGYKDNAEYSLATLTAAEKAGADVIALCDTNGGSLPTEIAHITGVARAQLKVRLGTHTHDDAGLGVANALAALEAGASHAQGTINGYGERTGNCNLTSLIPNIVFKLGKSCVRPSALPQLKDLSQFVDEIANLRHNPRQPWVGSAAFAHKGGTHVNAVQKIVRSYEHIDPAEVGNTRNVLISDLAGRSNIVMKARELGIELSNDAPELKDILARVKAKEHEGYEFEAAGGSLALLIRKSLGHKGRPIKVISYHISMRHNDTSSVCEATIKVQVDGKREQFVVAEGDGPVNALDSALRRALSKYPLIKAIQLTDYKVRILDSGTGTGAKTRVLIQSRHGREEWGTVGVSDNIIEASWLALVDGFEYRFRGA